MVGQRRFGPLIAVTAVSFLVLVGRLFQVQVSENEVWAKEAANLVRSWTTVPFRRGEILDRKRRPIARDEDRYQIDLVWRDFRRGQLLGQVAQARSLLAMRPISLLETLEMLPSWAVELVHLAPHDIDQFGRGAAVETRSLSLPEAQDAKGEQRWSRRGDLHFYVKALLAVEPREARALRAKRGTSDWERAYVELIAEIRRRRPQEVELELEQRARESLEDLERLAELLARQDATLASDPLNTFVQRVENTRRRVEDAAADDLFQAATGFSAWRLSADNLQRIDLDWMRLGLYWDGERLDDWIQRRGTAWDEVVEEHLAGRAIAAFKSGAERPEDRVLDGLAHFFRRGARTLATPSVTWRSVDQLVALRDLQMLFEEVRFPALDELPPVLPFQDPELRATSEKGLALLDRVLARIQDSDQFDLFAWDEKRRGTRAATKLYDAARDVSRPTWSEGESRAVALVLRAWNLELQRVVTELLDQARASLDDTTGPLLLQEERRKTALEERDYAVRDHGARPQRFESNPSGELVLLVTRFPERYAGLAVRTTTQRVSLTRPGGGEEDDRPALAKDLVGDVRSPYLVDVFDSVSIDSRIHALRTHLRRSQEQEELLHELVGKSLHPGQVQGGRGIEGYFDRLLSGENGYTETQGLEERHRSTRSASYRAAVDGLNLILTLDLDMQLAAETLIQDPPPAPPEERRPDDEWSAHPVGAIVLATPDGDVLAAASAPARTPEDGSFGEWQDGQRQFVLERCLRQPVMQPPGSVFKPFIALWAMQFAGLDPHEGRVHCVPKRGELPSWGWVHCHSQSGHSALPLFLPVDLPTALRRSCNVYFSHVGDLFFDGQAFRSLVKCFGFGRPTGVRSLPPGLEGLGLREEHSFHGPLAESGTQLVEPQRQRLGNGLSHISVNPMQVARAYAGLATGVLPEMRLVNGHKELQRPRESVELPFSPEVLGIVRRSLAEVVSHRDGSAHGKGLDVESLGFRVACKTGSADYRKGMVPDYPLTQRGQIRWVEGMRKHTWVAGWAPAEDPKLVFVVYVHDTATTSSHGAVYLAAQLLASEAVQTYLSESDAQEAGVGR